jgi:aminopeptidase N
MTKNTKPETVYLKDYTSPTHMVTGLNLLFQIFETHTLVTQTAQYKRIANKRCDLQLNHGKDIELQSLEIDGRVFKNYKLDEKYLTISCPGDSFEIKIITKIKPQNNTSLNGLYKSNGTYCTQCEAEGFRNITFWMDRPDVMTDYTVRIEASKQSCPVLLSNGNCIDFGDIEGGRHYSIWQDPFAKPCYLFALVAGDLQHIEDQFETKSGRNVTLKIYAQENDLNQVDFAMQALKDSMEWDEDKYGLEYDLDIFNIVAIGDFNMGAMENKSLNIFNTALVLANPETATDMDYLRIERVIGHEYFHNWSGNRVTCRDWFQLSLKEGFTVYRENQFGQDMNDPIAERIDEVKLVRDMQFSEDASPMAHPIRPESYIEINNFYTITVYEKGGEVIRMLHTLLGDEMYYKGTELYFSRHDGQAATCEDFVKAMEDVSAHKDLIQFRLWYSQAGTPNVNATESYDEKTRILTVRFEQSIPDTPRQKNKKPMVIPIKTGLLDSAGKTITEDTFILKNKTHEFTFKDVDPDYTLSYLREFSAPIILTTNQTDQDLMFLMAHDDDGFNRWESMQKLALKSILSILNNQYSGLNDDYRDAIVTMVESLKDDNRALLVRMLSLPDDSVIAQVMSPIDPDAIAHAKNTFRRDIAEAINHLLPELYSIKNNSSEFSIDPDAMADRALRNLTLGYIAAIDNSKAIRVAYNQYQSATNMTEKLGALSILVETDRPEREYVVSDFYENYYQHDLALNKWFTVQACARRDDTPARVKELMKHKDFTLSNPNRLRSLIGAYTMRNLQGFHVASGEGYKLLADMVLKLNDKNPQIAARLLTPMRQWKDYTENRQILMKQQLERILAQDGLSPDVYEIAYKCLKG